VTSLPSLVGDAAVLFDPYDRADIASAIHRLWTDGQLRQELIARGRAKVGELDWQRCAARYRDLYRRVARRLPTEAQVGPSAAIRSGGTKA
jgi:glycosyltransferase involved in cell wall biosynthesis